MRGFVIGAAFLLFLGATGAGAQSMKDNFDSKVVDGAKWSNQQIQDQQRSFLDKGRCGPSAIDIKIQDGDGGDQCDADEVCQRAELRNVKPLWPVFGNELWYSFSFKIEGHVEPMGSDRLVVGQWKAPGDHSPMLAQRFDNGVFHITVQDNKVRRVVASAEGDPEAIQAVQEQFSKLDASDAKTVNAIRTLQSFDRLAKQQPEESKELLSEKFIDALDNKASMGEYQKLAASFGLPDGALISGIGNLSYVANPEEYIGPAEIEIVPEQDAVLPNPSKNWVDMVYRIKPGRTDNEYGPKTKAEIEIWADGKKIVTVRGNVGGTLLKKDEPVDLIGPRFKFGIYRKQIAGILHFQLDEYSQAPTKDGLEPFCKAK